MPSQFCGPAGLNAEARGPVLPVDGFSETGRPLAVAARVLRRAGTQRVLPLVLGVRG
ncbi:hypothetical protein ABZY09_31300 [Streptomyces sp. NPDC002928]|uniref:hypothetical protein n=1 Tax=Streptomyces sp. NPDC002928 TaxID=3154440 RepID=UPI0033A3D3F6